MRKASLFLTSLFITSSLLASGPGSQALDAFVADHMAELKAFYLERHQSPELSLAEKETSKTLATELRKLGFEVTENMGGYGVVGVLKNGKGPTVLYRTDMDALPMVEKTGLDYASQVKVNDGSGGEVSTMHSCGHDMHMTVWLGTAKAMVDMKSQWKGTLVMIGQPAEEIGAGAKLMLEAGLYEKFPVPDYGVGLHCSPTIPTGKVGFGKGYTMANSEAISIKVFGQGAHGASPHMSIDPVVMASMLVMELQTIVSRNLNPLDNAVVSVGVIKGGTKYNIIPDEVTLELTVRTFTEEVRLKIHQRIKEIARGVAISAGLPEDKYPEVIIPETFTPANFNNEALVDRLSASATKAIGADNVVTAEPQMVAEDFSRYGKTTHKVPTTLFWLGTVPPERAAKVAKGEMTLPGLHSPFYYPAIETSIATGVKVTSTGLLDLFKGGK
ncbi:MAG: amidohydrolase [Imperialibacter sp.]|uniref:M20 metallopeptidase family protein n=1 Tax=Imperialibacter sp. TaxID=2038411 RepID=UPI0032EEEE20